jgi:hypothetical protein
LAIGEWQWKPAIVNPIGNRQLTIELPIGNPIANRHSAFVNSIGNLHSAVGNRQAGRIEWVCSLRRSLTT